jgi:hypothetical protein
VASGRGGDRVRRRAGTRRALAAGFQMHLAKPILLETLANAVAKLAEVPAVE